MAAASDAHSELRLLRTSLSGVEIASTKSPPQVVHNCDTLLHLVEVGRYLDALQCSDARRVLGTLLLTTGDSRQSQHYFQGVRERATTLRTEKGGALLSAAVGVSALYAFVQVNILGPQASFPSFPLARSVAPPPANADIAEVEDADGFADFAARLQSGSEPADSSKGSARAADETGWDDWARRELTVDGTDVLGRYALPQYLLLAHILLVEPHVQGLRPSEQSVGSSRVGSSSQEPVSVLPPVSLTSPEDSGALLSGQWWAARVLLVHQRLLSEPSASLQRATALLLPAVLQSFGSASAVQRSLPVSDAWRAGEPAVIAGIACLEAGLAQHAYKHTDAATKLFQKAAQEAGLRLELSGALGVRTPHQKEAKAQMVVQVAATSAAPGHESDDDESASLSRPSSIAPPPQDKFAADTEVFMQPKLVGSDQPQAQERLSSVAQCLLLAQCLDVRKQSPSDELLAWQAAPYLEAVQAQQRQRPSVRAVADLTRARWERHRGRTRERAFVTMQQLVDELRGANIAESAFAPSAASRMRYGLSVWFPSWAALQKELGEEMIRNGMVGAALDIFEQLELWDNLIFCLKGLGKVSQATSLVRERLAVSPRDPRLWCSLGDLTLDDACYTQAWQVSEGRHARAQRSLAKSAQGRGDFAAAITHWEIALAINPLFSGAWFELAFAALKEGDDKKALKALTRTVQLEPDNGEAWNNIGALNLKAGNSKEALIALQEAIKYRHEQWQAWENFGKAALEVDSYAQACRAANQVLELSNNKRVDVNTLSQLVGWVERSSKEQRAGGEEPEASGRQESNGARTGPSEQAEPDLRVQDEPLDAADVAAALRGPDDGREEATSSGQEEREGLKEQESTVASEREIKLVGDLLKRAVSGGDGGASLWGLQARFFEATGDGAMAKESRLRQVRALQGSQWQQDEAAFEALAAASLSLAEAYVAASQVSSREGTGREKRGLGAAKLQLRGVIKQAEERFGQTANYAALVAKLAAIEEALNQFT